MESSFLSVMNIIPAAKVMAPIKKKIKLLGLKSGVFFIAAGRDIKNAAMQKTNAANKKKIPNSKDELVIIGVKPLPYFVEVELYQSGSVK